MQFYVDKRHMRHLRIVSSTFCEAGLIKSLQSRQGVFKSFFFYICRSHEYFTRGCPWHTLLYSVISTYELTDAPADRRNVSETFEHDDSARSGTAVCLAPCSRHALEDLRFDKFICKKN